MCFGNQHTFTHSPTAVDTVSLSLRCACGAMSRGDIAPLQRLQADNAALAAQLAQVQREAAELRAALARVQTTARVFIVTSETQAAAVPFYEIAAIASHALAAAEAAAAGE